MTKNENGVDADLKFQKIQIEIFQEQQQEKAQFLAGGIGAAVASGLLALISAGGFTAYFMTQKQVPAQTGLLTGVSALTLSSVAFGGAGFLLLYPYFYDTQHFKESEAQ